MKTRVWLVSFLLVFTMNFITVYTSKAAFNGLSREGLPKNGGIHVNFYKSISNV